MTRLKPALAARALNSSLVLSLPPSYKVISTISHWATAFVALVVSGNVGSIESITITFPSSGIAL
uniref:Uncharacterized protein n=1 Tax=Cucumis sativus TaxID=3659 RepID=A0A0A0L260_CUCSA